MAVIPTINRINDNLARMADGRKIRYLNVNDKLVDKDGNLFPGDVRRQVTSHGQRLPGLSRMV
jgi:hypothetical protein